MALTRKYLKSMGLTEEQVESIIDAHTETLEGLKNKAEQYEADAKRLKDVEKELNDLKAGDGKDYKKLWEDEKTAHSKTKSDFEAKETAEKVKGAYRAMLKEAGVSEKYLETVLRATDLKAVKLDKDGALEGVEALKESAKAEWADFISTTQTKGATVATPPGNAGAKKYSSREEIMKIADTQERQAAIQAHPDLF